MKIKSLRAFPIQLPFRFSFTHAHLKRKVTHSIIVETTLDSGVKGYGESLPRDYVTGETTQKVLSSYENLNLDDLSGDFGSYEGVVDAIKGHSFFNQDSKNSNAAKCAIELSLLDAFSKEFKAPFLSFYSEEAPSSQEEKCISGIISMGRIEKVMAYLSWVKATGFKQVKVKISGNVKQDLKRLALIRKLLGTNVNIRVDANMAFSFEDALSFLRDAHRYQVNAIEDPLRLDDLNRLPELKALTNAEIILDEPVCTLTDVRKFLEKSYFDTINIRISKCGGIIKSLEIADFLWDQGKGVQLGCQVGETSVLSAAGWHLMKYFGCLRYYEGGYESCLLSANITKEKFSIKKGGRLAINLSPYGLGVNVREDKILSLMTQNT